MMTVCASCSHMQTAATLQEGNTPLHVACAAQHTSTALLLISQGADLCKANAADQLPLDLFKTEQISISVSLEALTKGVPSALPYLKRCETQRQWEPLHIATAAGNFPAISTLIHYGYNLCDQKVCRVAATPPWSARA